MGKGSIVVATDGVGTKDFCRYVVDIIYYSSLPWFWKEHKAVNVKVYLKF